jgi:hypothetical protein
MKIAAWIVLLERSLSDLDTVDLNGCARWSAIDREFVGLGDRGEKHQQRHGERQVGLWHLRTSRERFEVVDITIAILN